MQSSPPLQRQRDRASSPQNGSEYSLDLDALTLDTHSEPDSPIPSVKMDYIRSDEINGPSDFTINMEKWMRGPLKRPAAWALGVLDGADGAASEDTEARKPLKGEHTGPYELSAQASRRGDHHRAHDSAHLPGITALDAQEEDEDDMEDMKDMDDENSETEQSLLAQPASLGRDNAAVPKQSVLEDDSAWDPYQPTSSPRPTRHNPTLQPTVEDYQSQFVTPAKRVPLTLQTSQRLPLSPGRPSSPTLSPIKTPSPSKALAPALAQEYELEALRSEVVQLREAQQQTTESIETWRNDLTSERGARQAMEAALDDANKRHEGELQAIRDSNDAECAKVDSLQSEARVAKDAEKTALELAQRLQKDLNDMQESEDAELHGLRWQQKQSSEAEQALRKSLQDAEEKANRLETNVLDMRRELDIARQQRIEADHKEKSRHQQSVSPELVTAMHNELAEIKALLAAERAMRAKEHEDMKELREELHMLQNLSSLDFGENGGADLAKLKAIHEKAMVDSANAIQKALDGREQLEKAMQCLREELEDENNHRVAAQQAAKSQEAARVTAEKETSDLREELASIHASSTKEQELQTRLEILQSELNNAKAELEEVHEINSTLDARIVAAVTKREEEWKRKVSSLHERERYWMEQVARMEKERKLMSKALLRQWGREECGVENYGVPEQQYKYRFAGPKGIA